MIQRGFAWWGRINPLVKVLMGISAILGVVLSIYAALSKAQETATDSSSETFLLYFLVNFNIFALALMIFIVGRNITKLLFERRKNILGSKLRLKLVATFVGLTLIPTAIVVVLASGLLSDALQGWLKSRMGNGIESAVIISQQHFNQLKSETEDLTRNIDLGQIEISREKSGLFSIRVYDQPDHLLREAISPVATLEDFAEPDLDLEAIKKAFNGKTIRNVEFSSVHRYIRVYQPRRDINNQQLVIVATARLDPELNEAFSTVNDAVADYERLKRVKGPLKAGYLLTLSLISAMILFAALWLSFYIAKQIVDPVEKLLKGTEAVAKGQYDKVVPRTSNDELGQLVDSFNHMMRELLESKSISESRRNLIEAVLSNLAVGVISIDKNRIITSVNEPVLKLYGEAVQIGKRIEQVITERALENILQNLESGVEKPSFQTEIQLPESGENAKIVLTAARIHSAEGGWIGSVLIFDDVTELAKAQSMSVWREVARRIAHEIKNPLTPIQLSAQRLKKLVGEDKILRECADTIVEHVDSIKRLANEFSKFARMPTVELKKADINSLLQEIIAVFADQHSELAFSVIPDPNMPELMIDKEQIRRALINLVDNAVAAVTNDELRKEQGFIKARTFYDVRKEEASIEVVDNGPGIPQNIKSQIFEPYFTTKGSGTGLGLAIVNSILTDHHGKIRVFDNQPRGAKFVIELPRNAPQGVLKQVVGRGSN